VRLHKWGAAVVHSLLWSFVFLAVLHACCFLQALFACAAQCLKHNCVLESAHLWCGWCNMCIYMHGFLSIHTCVTSLRLSP
jgi:hypothetical protein